MSIVELSAFVNRTSQQVRSGFQRAGTWARTKSMQIRRTPKTEENTGKRKAHALTLSDYIHTQLTVCICIMRVDVEPLNSFNTGLH